MPNLRRKPFDGRGPWCSVCGREVERVINTLDPAHPIGTCLYERDDHTLTGHGRVPAIADPMELRTVLNGHARRRRINAHYKHLADVPVINCLICKAKHPEEYARRKEGHTMEPGRESGQDAAGTSPATGGSSANSGARNG